MIRIINSASVPVSEILARGMESTSREITDIVAGIIRDVREHGDEALRRLTKQFDHSEPEDLEVTSAEIDEAFASVDPDFLEILRQAAANIRAFHEKQIRTGFVIADKPGVVMGQRIIPIEKAGLYVPGGTAQYPSSVLMNAIPAVLAGCREIVMITPPRPNGKINPVILAAAKIAGVHRIFKAGGAQAIAALAYGTETVPRVYKIVGPGNAFVAEAKRQVYGQVSIDMIAGPSEILVVADEKSNARELAADLLSQAEHDRMASAVLITPSETLAKAVQSEIELQLSALEREAIARASIEANGKIILTESIEAAIALSNEIAPEHLELCVDEPFEYLPLVTSAGSVFLGRSCPEALGDYFAGPNHILPTSGSAHFASPLSVDDFTKKSQYTCFSRNALGEIAEKVAFFARQEGLDGHARSAVVRLKED